MEALCSNLKSTNTLLEDKREVFTHIVFFFYILRIDYLIWLRIKRFENKIDLLHRNNSTNSLWISLIDWFLCLASTIAIFQLHHGVVSKYCCLIHNMLFREQKVSVSFSNIWTFLAYLTRRVMWAIAITWRPSVNISIFF
jgi:hypothetical protein